MTDAQSGAAIVGATISVFDAAGAQVGNVASDATGRYVTPQLPNGSYYAKGSASGYLAELYNEIACAVGCAVTSGSPISVPVSITVDGINFTLMPKPWLTGSVTDPNGAPVPGIDVLVFDTAGAPVQAATTDAAGAYSVFGLSSGYYLAKTSNASGFADVLYDGIACALGCDVTAGTRISVSVGLTTQQTSQCPPIPP